MGGHPPLVPPEGEKPHQQEERGDDHAEVRAMVIQATTEYIFRNVGIHGLGNLQVNYKLCNNQWHL
jgi:hypothetical protein